MTQPCGQHTIWEPQCGTCRRLADLEERAAVLVAVLGEILDCAAIGAGAVPKHVWDRAVAVRAALASPSVQPASERPDATGTPGDEALAKSDVASDSAAALAQAEGPRPFLMHLADTKAPRLSRHWACPEHGPVMRTDEDGCCPSCGRDCHPDAPPDVEGRKS